MQVSTRRRHAARVEELCGAMIRALGADPALQLRDDVVYRGSTPDPVTAPQLRPDLEDGGLETWRGVADGIALRRRFSDPQLHRRARPDDAVAGVVFDMLEQFRVESLAPRVMAGVRANLRHRDRCWSAAFRRSGLTETHTGLLLYAVAQTCRTRVTAEPMDPESEEIIESVRFAMAPQIGSNLETLRSSRYQQAAYAVAAREIAEWLARAVAAEVSSSRPDRTSMRSAFSLFTDSVTADELAAGAGNDRATGDDSPSYDVFTREYDVEDAGADVARPAVLRALRDQLDLRVAEQRVNRSRLTMTLRTLLCDPGHDGWAGSHETGIVDGRLLVRLIATPGERRVFRRPRVEPEHDCVVSFLLDCSGSMRRHAEAIAVSLDILVRSLDLAGVTSELLGFTTRTWNGGRALREWERAGRPERPGRLNERRHVVFKDADTTWRRARTSIAGLLSEGLYREGVDGEAVQWACHRLRRGDRRRKVLVLVTDGSPMDASTNRANDVDYLDRHLRQVLLDVDASGDICLVVVAVDSERRMPGPHCGALDLTTAGPTGFVRTVLELLVAATRQGGWTHGTSSNWT